LGFSAATTLAAGLAGTVQWYLANDAWWRPILSGEYRDWYARQYPNGTGATARGSPGR
jgi:dTDP-glucose 4,6-dehydratase